MFKYSLITAVLLNSGSLTAATDAVVEIDAKSITGEIVDDFDRTLLPDKNHPHAKLHVRRKVLDQIEDRIRDGLPVATSYPLRPWRSSLAKQVNGLAAQLAELAHSEGSVDRNQRAVRALEILVQLAVLTANTTGQPASVFKPCLGLAAGLGVLAGCVSLVNGEIGFALAGSAVSSVILGAIMHRSAAESTYEVRLSAATEGTQLFWREVNRRVADLRGGQHVLTDLDQMRDSTFSVLQLGDRFEAEDCVRWLAETASEG